MSRKKLKQLHNPYLPKEINNKIHITPKLEAKTKSQKEFLQIIDEYDIILASGCPGCGKTYLATIKGLIDLIKGKYEKLILIRPAIEAEERIGFLPGDALTKVGVYMEPMFDAILEFLEPKEFDLLQKEGKIVIKPLGFLRGKTFKNCYVVADEMQNATFAQMVLLITRIGENSKMVISGDINQSDLDCKNNNALARHIEIFKNDNNDIGVFEFYPEDSVRHPIIEKYLKIIEINRNEQIKQRTNQRSL